VNQYDPWNGDSIVVKQDGEDVYELRHMTGSGSRAFCECELVAGASSSCGARRPVAAIPPACYTYASRSRRPALHRYGRDALVVKCTRDLTRFHFRLIIATATSFKDST